MAKEAPTKSNLLKRKQELKFARLGYELLDQKRNILVVELLNLVDQAVDLQSQVDESLKTAFQAFKDSVLESGKLKFVSLSSAINVQAEIKLSQRKVMGVNLPVVDTNFTENPPYFSSFGSTYYTDLTVEEFKEVLKVMGRLAELKVSIMRLAREVKKTIRKVNALEKIAIPNLEESVEYIQNRLEENERDMFILMKMVKERLERKKEMVKDENH
jgi:V/A-type H+/Na+-transporting ATPase subunit D